MASPAGQSERKRLDDARTKDIQWRMWGPYLSERQWGTVREDYSQDGAAWDYFSHDQARSRAYHWGEDGVAGISDDKQRLCFALALWNGADPILKERLFGLTNSEGNHGEDVKEYYFYLDNTPTHSYMKYLYKYPQSAYPYEELIRENRRRSRTDFEYELLDTGIFESDRYFDVFIEYGKRTTEDVLIEITVWNRGPEPAVLQVLPTLWFRNTWAWGRDEIRPWLERRPLGDGNAAVGAHHWELGEYIWYADRNVPTLFTENETNNVRIFHQPNTARYVKDGINDYVVQGRQDAVNPAGKGTKCAMQYILTIPAGKSETVQMRLCRSELQTGKPTSPKEFFANEFPSVMADRKQEADAFYESVTPPALDADSRSIMRQALAGMLWSKQHYLFDLQVWLREHNAAPGESGHSRNQQWFHMLNDNVISMPDKWEYPWYAAWDLAFHTIALAIVDMDFAKRQLDIMFDALYLHPSGQIPSYEWNFGDVNPPVHAWASLYLYNLEKELTGKEDLAFLTRSFERLMFNFSWWVNRKDPSGHNVFEGGFLGMDNIGVFDRSAALPTGGYLEQSDGTAWMAFFCQNMLEIAVELARHDPSYEVMATKFCEHFIWIASAMDQTGQGSLWDEEDGFFYDVLRLPDGTAQRLKVRSLVGLLPLCAATVFQPQEPIQLQDFAKNIQQFIQRNAQLTANIAPPLKKGCAGRHLLAILSEEKLRRLLKAMLDENEFLSRYGIRSLSRYHLDHPYVLRYGSQESSVAYEPAESHSGTFGGNSNWRGPIWMPINVLILRGLLAYYRYYGDDFKVECPTGSGRLMTLFEVAQDITHRLCSIFQRDNACGGHRPVFGGPGKFQDDPQWRDYPLFYEYFHGDNGAGIGASHQTGWTGLIARLLQASARMDAAKILQTPLMPAMVQKAAASQGASND